MVTFSRGGVSAPPLDLESAIYRIRLTSGQTLDLTGAQTVTYSFFSFVSGEGNVIVRDLHLSPRANFRYVTNTGTKNATWNGNATVLSDNLGDFTISVASGTTLTTRALSVANNTIIGGGNVSITELHNYPSIDLRQITNSGTQIASWSGSDGYGTFTGNLGAFTTTVERSSQMRISAELASGKKIIFRDVSGWVLIENVRQAPYADLSQITSRFSIEAWYDTSGPTTFTGNLGSQRSLWNARFGGVTNGDRIAYVSSSGPQPDSLSVNENGQWHWGSSSKLLTYCVNGVVYVLDLFGAEGVTHSNNFFTISR
jgi:hypothetical protein